MRTRVILGALLGWVLFVHLALGQAVDPRLAVIRITSHGCSGTVVETSEGKSVVLTCAHAWPDQAAVDRRLSLDVPNDPNGNLTPRQARMRILGIDKAKDLALIEVSTGPLPAICPLAPQGHRPGSNIWSVGYDEMTWPAVVRRATITGAQEGRTITKERPWHGRSGGGLIDMDAKVLIGVVSAYTGPQTKQEVVPGAYGVYVDHPTCLDFVLRLIGGGGAQPPPQGGTIGRLRIEQIRDSEVTHPLAHTAPRFEPRITETPAPRQQEPPRQFIPQPCPGGVCPGRR